MVTFNPNDSAGAVAQPMATDRGLVHEPELHGVRIGPAHSHVCWGAVIAGALAATSLMILSSSLAYACGVPAYSGGAYGWGAGIWAVLTSIIAFFVGGAVVSYFASRHEQRVGLLHGVMSWILAVPLMMILTASAFGLFHTGSAGEMVRANLQPLPNQPTWGEQTGAAWAGFLSLALGLIAAAIGGMAGFMSKSETACKM